MTSGEQVLVAVLFGVGALASLVLGLLGGGRRLPRNPLFGVRTRRSMASDEAWREVHARFAPFAYVVAVVWAVTAAAPFVASGGEGLVLGGVGLGLGVMVWGAARAHRGLG